MASLLGLIHGVHLCLCERRLARASIVSEHRSSAVYFVFAPALAALLQSPSSVRANSPLQEACASYEIVKRAVDRQYREHACLRYFVLTRYGPSRTRKVSRPADASFDLVEAPYRGHSPTRRLADLINSSTSFLNHFHFDSRVIDCLLLR